MTDNPTAAGYPAAWWLTWALIGLGAAATVVPGYLNHDAAWYLHMVGVMLDGGTIYRDVIDTNPPLIVYLTTPPVWLGRVTGVSDVALFKMYVFGGAILSLATAGVLARRIWTPPAVAGPLITAVAVFLALPFAKGDFGQREHLAVLMVLPYVFAAAAWMAGRPLRAPAGAAMGLVGGLGFAMKPHFALAWLALEAWLAFAAPRRRSWRRPELLAAAAALVAYALVVLFLVPQYLALADVARQVYGGLNSSPAVLLRLPDARLWGAGVVLLLLIRLPRESRALAVGFFAAATGFVLAAVLQLKGWQYHLYPGRVFLLLFFVVFVMEALRAAPGLGALFRGGVRSVAAVVVALMLVSCVRYVIEATRPVSPDLVMPLREVVERHAPRGPLAVLSMRTIIYPAFPVVNYTRAAWSMRHNSLWFLPGLYADVVEGSRPETDFRRPEAMGAIERAFFDQIVSDLCANPPELLVVEPPIARAAPGRRSLDLLAYYGQDPRFARLRSGYADLTVVGPFVVLARAGAPPSCGH